MSISYNFCAFTQPNHLPNTYAMPTLCDSLNSQSIKVFLLEIRVSTLPAGKPTLTELTNSLGSWATRSSVFDSRLKTAILSLLPPATR